MNPLRWLMDIKHKLTESPGRISISAKPKLCKPPALASGSLGEGRTMIVMAAGPFIDRINSHLGYPKWPARTAPKC